MPTRPAHSLSSALSNLLAPAAATNHQWLKERIASVGMYGQRLHGHVSPTTPARSPTYNPDTVCYLADLLRRKPRQQRALNASTRLQRQHASITPARVYNASTCLQRQRAPYPLPLLNLPVSTAATNPITVATDMPCDLTSLIPICI